jgi:hypothetical protein
MLRLMDFELTAFVIGVRNLDKFAGKNRKRLSDPCPYTWEKLATPAWDLVIVGMRLSAFYIGRACDAGLVGVLREVPDAIEKGLGPSAVYLKSEAAPHSYPYHCYESNPKFGTNFPLRSTCLKSEAAPHIYPKSLLWN